MVERIAVLRANSLGDFIFCLPALDALRAAHPEAQITLLALPWHGEFLRDRPGPVDRVVVVPPSRGVRDEPGAPEHGQELNRFFARMRAERFDIALQMHGGGRWSNPFVRQLGARLTAGCRADDAPPLDRWIPYVYFQHEVHRYLEIAGLVGAAPVTLEPAITVTPADRRESARFARGGSFVVLHPGASAARRRWPAERFGRIGEAFAQRGLRVVVTGAAAERELVAAVRAAIRAPSEDACDALSLGGLAALLADAAVVVSNDTGPLHLAAAVGGRTVGIFWVGNMINAAPAGRARHRPVIAFRTRCPVCGLPNITESCEHPASFVQDVAIEPVLDAALDLLAGSGEARRES